MLRSAFRPTVFIAVAATMIVGPLTAPVGAQATGSTRRTAPWGLVNAIGYGGLGVGTGLVLMWEQEIGPAYTVMLGTGVAGIVTGAVMGRRGSAAARSGRPIGAGHRRAVLAGAVFAGATLGAAAAIPLVNGEATGTPLGSDETTVALTMLGGTLVGAGFAALNRDDFAAARVGVAPYRSREGTTGVGVHVAF